MVFLVATFLFIWDHTIIWQHSSSILILIKFLDNIIEQFDLTMKIGFRIIMVHKIKHRP